MKRLLYLTLASLFFVFSCQKENIDEIIVNDFNFEPDTIVEKDGFIRVEIDGEVVLDEPGYAFICDATHRNEVNYMIANDFTPSLAFFDHPSNQDVQISSSFRWTGSKKNVTLRSFGNVLNRENKAEFYTSILSNETNLDVIIIEQGEKFIKGYLQGKFQKKSDGEESLVAVSGEFNLPLYKNCEIGLPIERECKVRSTVHLPYDLPQVLEVNHIICTEGNVQKNLISTVPANFTQLQEAPESLLQNENDYYIYWEHPLNDIPSEVSKFECRIKVELPNFKGVAELSDYQSSQLTFDKKLRLEQTLKHINTIGILKNPKNEEVLGLGFMIILDTIVETTDCQ